MAFVITSLCTKDYKCVAVCPVDCIHEDGQSGTQLIINPDECIDCGACAPECPVEAIFALSDLPDAYAMDAERNAAPFRGPNPPPVAVAPA